MNATELTSPVVTLGGGKLPIPGEPGARKGARRVRRRGWWRRPKGVPRPAPILLCLSYRDVEELLFARGMIVTYEAIRQWCRKFGQSYANELRHRRPRPGDKWHLDEVFLTIHGERHYLWRAVDQDGHILDILVQSRRNTKAAKKFFRKLLKRLTYVPRVIITDQLKSYEAAKREIMPGVEHRQHRYLNNRAENSHQPTRHRERRMQGCKSPGHAQRFLSAHGPIAQHFRPRRHRCSAPEYRRELGQRFRT